MVYAAKSAILRHESSWYWYPNEVVIHVTSAALCNIDIGSLKNSGNENVERSFPIKSLKIYQKTEALTLISGLTGKTVLNFSFPSTINLLNYSFNSSSASSFKTRVCFLYVAVYIIDWNNSFASSGTLNSSSSSGVIALSSSYGQSVPIEFE